MPHSLLSVVVTRRLPKATEDRLAQLFDVKLNQTDTDLAPSDLLEAVKGANVIVPTLNDEITKDVMEAAGPSLRMIANFGSGTDHIDVKAAHKLGIMVTNSPADRPDDTADMTFALLLAVMRRFKEGSQSLQSNEWEGWSPTGFLGARVGGKTLGIIGMGRVGEAVAARANVFGMKVLYHNRRRIHGDREAAVGAEYVANLDDMLRRVDALSINCPLTQATHHLLDARRLGLMRDSAYIVNTSRGEVIDEAALTGALKAGRLAGAGLDVFETGPNFSSALRDLNTVMLLPHMASATSESRHEMGEKVIINIKTFEDGHRPPNRVIPVDM
jgi:glyoxylate reductase